MELILISDSKLKVMLTQSDMEQYSLTNEKLDYDNTETRKAFWDILDEAKHRTGFDAAGDKIFVQVYQSRHGGCEMYVTKLPGRIKNDYKINIGVHEMSEAYYRFDSISELVECCRALKCSGCDCESAAYVEKVERCVCYLLVYGSKPPVLSEYGRKVNIFTPDAYIAEYCIPIINEKAVETLGLL